MRQIVGYFDGTDSAVLTDLVCDGYDTVPISNGFDNHGMHVRIINNENRVDVLIGYVHKIYSPVDSTTSGGVIYQDVFHISRTFDIPLILIIDRALHDKVRGLLHDTPPCVHFVDPTDLLSTIKEILKHPESCSE